MKKSRNSVNQSPSQPVRGSGSGNGRKRTGNSRTDKERYLLRLYVLLGVIIVLLAAILMFLPTAPPAKGNSERPPLTEQNAVPEQAPQANVPAETEKGTGGQAQPVEPGAGTAPPPGRRKLAIVIDDVGYNLDELQPFLKLSMPLTFAVLPKLRYSSRAAQEIRAAGQQVIMHLPMEAEHGEDPGPGAILTSLSDDEIRQRVAEDIATIPGIVGVNNHMGSLATSDLRVMDVVAGELAKDKLFFLDSRTSAGTVGKTAAGHYNLPYMERSVFLDNERNREYIHKAILQGMDIAEQQGHAVMIGHVMTAELAQTLQDMYPFIMDEGFDLYHLSDLLPVDGDDEDTWD